MDRRSIPATVRQAAQPHQATLDSLVGIALQYANEQLMAMITGMAAALLDVTAPQADTRTVYQRVKSGNLLKNNSYAFFHLVSSGLKQALEADIALLRPAGGASPAAPQVLSLVPLEEMDKRVTFGVLSRPFDIAHAEPLATLNVRLGFLLERAPLRPGQNPFRPEVFLLAIQQAWQEFEPDIQAHGLILPLMRPEIVFDFAPMLAALDQALRHKAGRAPSAGAERVRRTADAEAARAAARADSQAVLARQLREFLCVNDPAAALPDLSIPLIPDLPGPSQGNGWRPSAVAPLAGSAGQHAVASAAADSARRHEPAGAAHADGKPMGAAPEWTHEPAASPCDADGDPAPRRPVSGVAGAPLLDLLLQRERDGHERSSDASANGAAALPHNVFYLPRLKRSLPRGALSRADESTLDLLARIFETVFLDESIPAATRELIQFLQVPVLKAALMDSSFFFQEAHPARRMIDLLSRMGWEQRKDADDPVFASMRRGVDRVGRDFSGEPEVFAEVVAELEASIAADERAGAASLAAPVAAALKQEQLAVARRAALDAVALRVGGGDVVAVVTAFLQEQWMAVLTLACGAEEQRPGAVGNATRVMDELVWSVKPKPTQEQRKGLIARLPGLLSALNKWLDLIKWDDAQRLQFFAELAECHAAIVRAPLDLSPARQLEVAVEAAQQDALRRIAQEQAAAARAEAAPADEAVSAVDGLERGIWLEFTHAGTGVRKVRLAWVSPLRTLYIFSTATRQEAFSLAADKLADAFRAGTVRVLQLDGVVGRVLSQAMEQAAVNDAAISARSAVVA